MERGIWALLAAIFLACGFLSASSITMMGDISQDGTDNRHMTIDVPANQPFAYTISGQLSSISVRDENGQSVEPDVRLVNGSSIITMQVPSGHAEAEIITDFLTAKTGDTWRFNSTSAFSVPLDSLDSKIKLPPGATVIRTNGMVQDEFWGSSILWHYDKVGKMESLNRFIVYKIKEPSGYPDFFLMAGMILAALAIGYALRWATTRKHAAPGWAEPAGRDDYAPNPAFAALEETDKEIVREIRAQGGKTTQAHIYSNTHIKKATLSRHLALLEARGLVKRSQKGIKKLVSLTPLLHGKDS